jgi:Histidine kinase-, DNA gyrase B-, and HSP90-like ATPase
VVRIRPEVKMYRAFARLNYTPWHALAEFVDNSVQSALTDNQAIKAVEGEAYRLRVDVDIADGLIEVRDNAGGIGPKDYDRAFLPAAPPEDVSGLSEFGLGMKAAASWFGQEWSVRTSAIGEPMERTITFDIPKIVETNCEELDPDVREAPAGEHFTVVSIWNLNTQPQGRTLAKIKDHLCGIYRVFLRDGFMELWFNNEPLIFEEPECLYAPHHSTPLGEPILWRKDIELDLGDGHAIRGWAGLLARASVANAGFALFRRRRVIQGSHGDGYRPERIFGSSNKFVYQRLVGELEVQGFSVSHTKDGIQWEDWEDDVEMWLKSEIDRAPMRLIDQAANYRARAVTDRDAVREAALDVSRAIAQHLPSLIDEQVHAEPQSAPLPQTLGEAEHELARTGQIELQLEHARKRWTVTIELVCDDNRNDWYEISDDSSLADGSKIVSIRVNLAHPFIRRFTGGDSDDLVPFTRLAAALAIAEITAIEVGVYQADTVRVHLNSILRTALSGPIQHGEAADE